MARKSRYIAYVRALEKTLKKEPGKTPAPLVVKGNTDKKNH